MVMVVVVVVVVGLPVLDMGAVIGGRDRRLPSPQVMPGLANDQRTSSNKASAAGPCAPAWRRGLPGCMQVALNS